MVASHPNRSHGRNPNPYYVPPEQRQRQRQQIDDFNRGITQQQQGRMGIQSQRRNGSINTMRARSTLRPNTCRNRQQHMLDRSLPYDPLKRCNLCKAYDKRRRGLITRIPKRGHDKHCPKRRKNRADGVIRVSTRT